MDLITHLRSFVAVAESGTVTAAAAEVRAPQPVVSRRIMALEKHLGSALFTRSGRRVNITEAGRRLLPHAIDLVARADRFLELAATASDRRLRVGIPPDSDLAAMAAASVAAKAAGFELDVVMASRPDRQVQLAGGVLQIALADSPFDTADIAVVIGIGSHFVSPPTVSSPEDGWWTHKDGGAYHIDELRRRRSRGDRPLPRLFLCPEDDVGEVRRELIARIARAGLSPAQFEVPESVAGAITRVHAGDGVILCGRQLARRHGLAWRRLGGAPLSRCYRIASGQQVSAEAVEAIAPHLRDTVGGTVPEARTRSLAPVPR